MNINKYKDHLVIMPEDRAEEEIANGASNSLNIDNRVVHIDKPARGWLKVVKRYKDQVVQEMLKNEFLHVILLIDFDCDSTKGDTPEKRFFQVLKEIPDNLKDRTFVLGTLDEPEDLKTKLSMSLEKIGETLAEDCPDKRNQLWNDDMLKHNTPELERLIKTVKHFLFRK